MPLSDAGNAVVQTRSTIERIAAHGTVRPDDRRDRDRFDVRVVVGEDQDSRVGRLGIQGILNTRDHPVQRVGCLAHGDRRGGGACGSIGVGRAGRVASDAQELVRAEPDRNHLDARAELVDRRQHVVEASLQESGGRLAGNSEDTGLGDRRITQREGLGQASDVAAASRIRNADAECDRIAEREVHAALVRHRSRRGRRRHRRCGIHGPRGRCKRGRAADGHRGGGGRGIWIRGAGRQHEERHESQARWASDVARHGESPLHRWPRWRGGPHPC